MDFDFTISPALFFAFCIFLLGMMGMMFLVRGFKNLVRNDVALGHEVSWGFCIYCGLLDNQLKAQCKGK